MLAVILLPILCTSRRNPPGTTLFQQGSGEVMGNGELWGASSRPAVGFDHEVQGGDDGGNGSAEQCF